MVVWQLSLRARKLARPNSCCRLRSPDRSGSLGGTLMKTRWFAPIAALVFTVACSGRLESSGKASASLGVGPAAQVAIQLGLDPHFLIGMGNDLAGPDEGYDHNRDGIYTLGTRLDLHYCYLVGLMGQGGWPDWNPVGWFVNIMTDTAAAHGVVPMFTLYSMAAWGEGNMAVLTIDDYMRPYWNGAALLFDRLALFNRPAVVQLEPDFWAFAQQRAPGHDPARQSVHVSSLAPDCANLPDNLVGMGQCLIQIARVRAPQVMVGFHASRW